MSGPPFSLPWASFGDLVRARVHDPRLADQTFLTYCDDDRGVRRAHCYREFGERVERMVRFMRDHLGLRRGDRTATVLFNHDQTVVIYFAAWTLGCVVVPIGVEELVERKRYILEHSEATVVFCWQEYSDEITTLQRELASIRHVVIVRDPGDGLDFVEGGVTDPGRTEDERVPGSLDDEALIVYTSGTTGSPKGVVLTARNLLVDADGIAGWHGFRRGDRLMCVLPIHHVNGTVVTLVTPLYFGGGVVLNRRFKSGGFWRRLQDEQVTCISVVPTLLEFLLEANEDVQPDRLARFRGFICGAGPLLKQTAERFEDRFRFPIRHGYGLSETTCYSCFLPDDLPSEQRRHWLTRYEFPSIGVPLPHNDMAILDGQGREVPEMTRGEICIRGRTVCNGYFKRPDATKAAFQWGWFRSGDEGFFSRDETGRPFFFISGRLKELIIRGGVNISPLEIDDVLKGHSSVKFAMAIPFENRYYGEEIAVYVVTREDVRTPTEPELLAFCRSRLPFFKCPKVILFGHEVPYTATGKPKRLELKAHLAPSLSVYRDRQFREQP